MGCRSLLQGTSPTQGSNQGLLHCRQILYHLSHQGSPSKSTTERQLSFKGNVCGIYVSQVTFFLSITMLKKQNSLPGHVTCRVTYRVSSHVAQTVSVCLQYRNPGFDPWVRKIPWRRKWQPTPVFLPGKFHGWRSLVGYPSMGRQRVGHD